MTDPERIDAMEKFMQWNFPNERFAHADHFHDRKGFPMDNGFVEFGSAKQLRRIADEVRKKSFTLYGYDKVKIRPALTDIDLNRNWALRTAEEKIRAEPGVVGKDVTVKKGEGRGVYVAGEAAFTQEIRHAKDGQFVGAFAKLALR